MDVLLVTLFLGFVLALLIVIPGLRKSDPGSSHLSSSAGDKVYDVTSYVEEHPGGDAILTHAGDDSTEGFFGPQHATRVFDMIEDFCVGDMKK